MVILFNVLIYRQYTEDGDGDDGEQAGGDGADQQRTTKFTLQDHPSQLSFSGDGNNIYMSMDIDPNSEENEKRRPAFLVYLDLTQNQSHRCKTVDRIVDHQTEFIVCFIRVSFSRVVVFFCLLMMCLFVLRYKGGASSES